VSIRIVFRKPAMKNLTKIKIKNCYTTILLIQIPDYGSGHNFDVVFNAPPYLPLLFNETGEKKISSLVHSFIHSIINSF